MNWLTIAGLTGLQNGLNVYLNERNNKAQMALAEQKYQNDLKMWQLQNEYNSPSRQVERLVAANLSPHLVYGGGNVTGNSAGAPPDYAAPKLNPSQVPDMLGQYMAAKNSNESNRLLDAQISQVKAQTLNTLATTPGIEADSAVKRAGAAVAQELARQSVEQSSLITQKLKNDLILQGLEKTVKEFEAEIAKRGFTKQDPVWIRSLLQAWTELSGESIETLSKTESGSRIQRIMDDYEKFAKGGQK